MKKFAQTIWNAQEQVYASKVDQEVTIIKNMECVKPFSALQMVSKLMSRTQFSIASYANLGMLTMLFFLAVKSSVNVEVKSSP